MKRRDDKKKIMPEVLPDPTRSLGPGGPRQRTLNHMNRLLAMTAAGAAIGACSKQTPPSNKPSTIEVPQPPADDTSTAEDTPPPARSDASVGPVGSGNGTEPIPEPTGYAVVDPMPPPARCIGLAQTVKAKTKWKSKTVLELRLGKPTMTGSQYDTSEAPNVSGGTLKKKTIAKDSVVLEIEVPAGTNAVYAYIGASCPAGPQHIGISIGSSSGALAQGTTPVVSLNDNW